MRIGLISFAHMHMWSYARHLAEHPDAEIAAVLDLDPERGQKACEKLGIETYHAVLPHFLQEPMDAVVICSENARHAGDAVVAAGAGKHILCEKPLASTVEGAVNMVRACRGANVNLMTAFPCRFHPAAARAHDAVSQGRVGRVLAVSATNHGQNPGGWFVNPDLSGGGAIMDHTVHVVDLLRWMTGQEVREVYAEAVSFNDALPCEDGGLLSLRFGDFIATLDTSWSRPPSAPVWGDVTMEIIGSDGVLSLDLFAQEHVVIRERESRIRNENWGDDMDGGLVDAFIESVSSGDEPAVTGLDGLRAVEVVEAAYRSVKSGRPEVVEHHSP